MFQDYRFAPKLMNGPKPTASESVSMWELQKWAFRFVCRPEAGSLNVFSFLYIDNWELRATAYSYLYVELDAQVSSLKSIQNSC